MFSFSNFLDKDKNMQNEHEIPLDSQVENCSWLFQGKRMPTKGQEIPLDFQAEGPTKGQGMY